MDLLERGDDKVEVINVPSKGLGAVMDTDEVKQESQDIKEKKPGKKMSYLESTGMLQCN